MEHAWLHTLDSLSALTTVTPEQRAASAALWAMTPAQRQAAMWRRELSLLQLTEWSRRAPHEVPTVNDLLSSLELGDITIHDLDGALGALRP